MNFGKTPVLNDVRFVSWFCPGLMDSFIKTACLLFKSHRTDITKITVTAFSIIKTLDVFEQKIINALQPA